MGIYPKVQVAENLVEFYTPQKLSGYLPNVVDNFKDLAFYTPQKLSGYLPKLINGTLDLGFYTPQKLSGYLPSNSKGFSEWLSALTFRE